MDSDSEQAGLSSPDLGSESRGSSVSTALREEYEDLLRYAVVTPVIDLSTKGLKSKSSKTQYHPSSIRPPQPQSPLTPIQPQVNKVASDISDPSDLQQPSETRPPPPFTAMTVQHEMTQPNRSHDTHHQSHDVPSESYDESVESHDESGMRSHDESGMRSHDVDPEMVRLESQLDGWCLDLKRNILAEFEQGRLRLLERREADHQRERQQNACELGEAHAQLEQFKELLSTYEQSIGRKDHVIANLTAALQKQKERVELQQSFGSWKLRHSDERREAFTVVLARKHHHQRVKGRVWEAWYGLIQSRWKQRVEKACQSKAEEVCVQLSGDYEEQLEALGRSLEESKVEVQRLKAERDLYEENMKKAFMRGVCALNMEAMSMFQYRDADDSNHCNGPSNHGDENNTPKNVLPSCEEHIQHTPTPSVDPPPARNGRTSAPTSHVTRAPHHVVRTGSHVTNTAKIGRGASRPRPDIVVQKH